MMAAAARFHSSMAWEYTRRVREGSEWPRKSTTVRMSMPARMSWIAVKCRRLWRRTSGAPTASRTRKKNDVTLSGRKGGAADSLEGRAHRRQRSGVEVVHLVDEEQCAALSTGCRLADLTQQLDKVLFWISRVGHAGDGIDVKLELHATRSDHAERLDHPESPLDPVAYAVPTAHLPQQPGGHLGEGRPEVGLGADLLHVGRSPARFGGEEIQLHEQHGLPHPSQAVEDPAAIGAPGSEDLDQRAGLLEVPVPAGHVGRFTKDLVACTARPGRSVRGRSHKLNQLRG